MKSYKEVIEQFFVSPTKDYILKQCNYENSCSKTLDEIKVIFLPISHIRKIEEISKCQFITVCILSNNFIINFDQLKNCKLLEKLDLHYNQITNLPDESFWESLKYLKLLLLHDNGISQFEDIKSLFCSPSLIALTLYNTPFSLKKSYRHQVVNSLFTLQALDYHVISDEEIIEDIKFSSNFAKFSPVLQINLCEENLKKKPFSVTREEIIEEQLNSVKKIERNIHQILVHGSPIHIIQRWIRGYFVRKNNSKKMMDIRKRLKIIQQKELSKKELQTSSENVITKSFSSIEIKLPKLDDILATPADTKKSDKTLNEKQSNKDLISKGLQDLSINTENSKFKTKKKSKTDSSANLSVLEESSPFRLSPVAIPIKKIQPKAEIISSNKKAGEDLRRAIDTWHIQAFNKTSVAVSKPKNKYQKSSPVSLLLMNTVAKAYEDREKSEKIIVKTQCVYEVKKEHEEQKQIVKSFWSEKRIKAINEKNSDELSTQEARTTNKEKFDDYIDLARKRKKMASEKHKQIHHDLLFMNNFVNQTCSLSKSFLRYDLKNQNNYLKMKKTVAVKKLQQQKEEQRLAINQYRENEYIKKRQKILQTKKIIKNHLASEKLDNLIEAQQRVSIIKQLKNVDK